MKKDLLKTKERSLNMTMKEILTEVRRKVQELEEKADLPETEEELYFKNFFEHNQLNGINHIMELDIKQFLTVYLLSNSKEFTIEEVEATVNSNLELLSICDSEDLNNMIYTFADLFEDDEDVEELKKQIQDKRKHPKTWNLKHKFSNVDKYFSDMIQYLEDLSLDGKSNPYKILDLIEKDPQPVFDGFALVAAIFSMNEEGDKFDQESSKLEEGYLYQRYSKKQQELDKNKYLKSAFDMKQINKLLNSIRLYYTSMVTKKKKEKRMINKQLGEYNQFISKFMQETKNEEITNFELLISKIPDENLRLEILKAIYLHNQKEYEKLEEEYQRLSQNSKARYTTLLEEFGIPSTSCQMEKIMRNSYDETEEILNKLRKLNITDPDILLNILYTTTHQIVDELVELVEKGLVSSAFLSEHNELFDETKKERKTLTTNIESLNEKGINPYYFSHRPDSLLLDSNILKHNLSTLEQYDYLPNMDHGINYDFLGEETLEEKLDKIIELGYETILEEDLGLLNYDTKKWNRFYVLKTLGMKVQTTEEIRKVLETKSFLVPDDGLEEYIDNQSQDEVEGSLESLPENSKRTYKIGEFIVSKNRVKRNLEQLEGINMSHSEKLVQSIILGSIMSEREFDSISKSLKKS